MATIRNLDGLPVGEVHHRMGCARTRCGHDAPRPRVRRGEVTVRDGGENKYHAAPFAGIDLPAQFYPTREEAEQALKYNASVEA